MIGTNAATLLVIVNFIAAVVLGVVAGGLSCLVLRRSWGLKVATRDAALAAAMAIISVTVITVIDNALGILESRVALVMAVAVGGVIVRHVIRRPLLQAKKERTLT